MDWWTLGAIIFEMLTGLPPFYTQSREELFERIKFSNLKLPSNITPACKDILEKLFNKNPEKRLGSGEKGPVEVKEHAWFANVNWETLLAK